MAGIIQELKEKINLIIADETFFTALILILVALASFGLGKQSVRQYEMENQASNAVMATDEPATAGEGSSWQDLPTTFYVASKNGQVYHLPHCSGAKRIAETNKITFKTKAEAEQAGYRPASNCKGI